MSRKRRAHQLELSFPAPPPVAQRPPGLWEEVDQLPEKALQIHRSRRKVVRPKLRQAELLEPAQGEEP